MEQNLKNRKRAQYLRKNMTKEENHLWYDFLKTYPVQFRRQYPVGWYYIDFFCYQAGIAIELDGSQHSDPESITYDKRRSAFLEERGLKVLRFSNLDVWRNFSGICEAIDMEVKKRIDCNKKAEWD